MQVDVERREMLTMAEQGPRETTTSKPAHMPKPTTMRVSFALQLFAAAAVIGIAAVHVITVERSDPAVGPLTYGIAILSGAVILGLVFLLSALRGTGGSRRGRLVATYLLALSIGLLLLGPAMLVAVLPSIAALALLWTPASSAFVRATSASGSVDDGDSEVAALLDSHSSGPRIPWANAMPGNPHQPGI